MADTLQKLFGSSARVKLLRLFLFNPDAAFTLAEVAARTQTPRAQTRKEIQLLTSVGFLGRLPRKRVGQYILKPEFPYTQALQSLVLNSPVRGQDVYKKIEGVGAIKLVIMSGIFLGEKEGSLDLFIVGDRINDKKLKHRLGGLESELGKELRYASLSAEEFFYRLNMSDRLLRDVFDYPHQIVYDKLDIGLK